MSPFDLPKRTTTLTNTYTPNFNDPRVRERTEKALTWCGEMKLSKRPLCISTDNLRKVFGNYSQPGLSQWLYSNLLTQTGMYAVGSHTFSYSLKQHGYEKVHRLMGIAMPTAVFIAQAKYAAIISDEEQIEYKDYGGRRWHPVQNMRREDRRIAFAGWYDYDIDACAPSLIYQYARTLAREEIEFPALARLIRDKANVRQHIANLIRADVSVAKELLQAYFFKAYVAPNEFCSVYRMMKKRRSTFNAFKADEFIVALQADMRKVWALIRDEYRRECAELGVKPTLIRGKLRNAKYIQLERAVMDAFESFFPDGRVPGILMHDGFMSRKAVPIDELVAHVQAKTGYSIRLKMERFGAATGEAVNDVDGTVKPEAA